MENSDEPWIIIVGGGPIGLWTSIGFKERVPGAKIIIFEKREEYARTQPLNLQHSGFMMFHVSSHVDLERNFFQAIFHTDCLRFTDALVHRVVMAKELEEQLKIYAIGLGVEIRHEEITDPRQLELLFPQCSIFIAADGSHSKIRDDLFGVPQHNTYQHVVDLRFSINAESHALGLSDSYKSMKIMNAMPFEFVKTRNGVTSASIQLFVDDDTYNRLPEMTFRDPFHLTQDSCSQLPSSLMDDINIITNTRKRLLGDEICPGSVRLTKFSLDVYKSEIVAKRFRHDDNRRSTDAQWFLVGDAAMGVPYFRSLHGGLLGASKLAHIAGNFFNQSWTSIIAHSVGFDIVSQYNTYYELLSMQEFSIASTKDALLNSFAGAVGVSGIVPWQTIRWTEEEIAELKQMNSDFV